MTINPLFVSAFSTDTISCRGLCECGKQFYDTTNSWDWEEGELDALEADDESVCLGYAISYVRINGINYVDQCDCWHEEAQDILKLLNQNGESIATLLNLHAESLRAQADRIQVKTE